MASSPINRIIDGEDEDDQKPAWLRYLPKTNWKPLRDVPAETEEERKSRIGIAPIDLKTIKRSSNPFSAEAVLTRMQRKRMLAAQDREDEAESPTQSSPRRYVSAKGSRSGGGRVRATGHRENRRVEPYRPYSKPKASVCEATALLEMWDVKKGNSMARRKSAERAIPAVNLPSRPTPSELTEMAGVRCPFVLVHLLFLVALDVEVDALPFSSKSPVFSLSLNLASGLARNAAAASISMCS